MNLWKRFKNWLCQDYPRELEYFDALQEMIQENYPDLWNQIRGTSLSGGAVIICDYFGLERPAMDDGAISDSERIYKEIVRQQDFERRKKIEMFRKGLYRR